MFGVKQKKQQHIYKRTCELTILNTYVRRRIAFCSRNILEPSYLP